MTAPKKYKKPAREENPDAVRVKPSDVVGSLLLVNVKEIKTGIKTKYSDDAEAVSLDFVSIETGNIAPDQLWFNGAIIDGLRDYVGDCLAVRLEWVTSQSSGNAYLAVGETSDEDDEAVAQFWEAHPNVFIFDTAQGEAPAPAATSNAKPAAKARW